MDFPLTCRGSASQVESARMWKMKSSQWCNTQVLVAVLESIPCNWRCMAGPTMHCSSLFHGRAIHTRPPPAAPVAGDPLPDLDQHMGGGPLGELKSPPLD